MRQTLFFIPDQLFGLPLFGMGWLLTFWLAGCVITLTYLVKKYGMSEQTRGFIPLGLIVAKAIFVSTG